MQRELVVKARSLGGASDLTLLARIKPGLIDSLETATYKSRVQRVLATLHGARQFSHEYAAARWLSDSIERVGAIQSVRVAVLEPQDSVMLAVSFDGTWENYIRVLWHRVGTLLDLIFCNTVDYVTARNHSFEEWEGWARRVQVETGFFYGPPETTARDLLFQRRLERMRERGGATELDEVRAVLPSAEDAVRNLIQAPFPTPKDEPDILRATPAQQLSDRARMGIKGTAALYRLTELHPPGTPDGEVLRCAAVDLLLEFVKLVEARAPDSPLDRMIAAARAERFARQLDWLFPPGAGPVLLQREVPAPAATLPLSMPRNRADIQGGILQPYKGTTHGALLLLAFDHAGGVLALLDWLEQGEHRLARDSDDHEVQHAPGGVFRNLAWTLSGLRMAGLDEDLLERFPTAFREGMARRAGLLGDVRNNHPRRWRRPLRFDPATLRDTPASAIDLEAVHAVLQWRGCARNQDIDPARGLADAGHPLHAELMAMVAKIQGHGVRILAVQPMRRHGRSGAASGDTSNNEHFGFKDGISQPEIDSNEVPNNRVHLGEVILGHDNAADFAWGPKNPPKSAAQSALRDWLLNGSFMALRSYRQFPHRLRSAVESAARAMTSGETSDSLKRSAPEAQELIYAKLMGRFRDGRPLLGASNKQPNNFDYSTDKQGQVCPLHAHIRLVNPRATEQSAQPSFRVPRIMRRGMPYGPDQVPEGVSPDEVDQGLIFMAYNADLGEQFEVVQRWLAGDNSTGASSAGSCPIVGVPENGMVRQFRFEYADSQGQPQLLHMALETPTPLLTEPAPFTQLNWGLYLFTPSFDALGKLRKVATAAFAAAPAQAPAWQSVRGRKLLAQLQSQQAALPKPAAVALWKIALQDGRTIDKLDAAALWSAIREDHGGLLSTPYGHLVAQQDLILEVLRNDNQRYSVSGQLERMQQCLGPAYLGMDDGPEYRAQSAPVNQAIEGLTSQTGYQLAFEATRKRLALIVEPVKLMAQQVHAPDYEVSFDSSELLNEALTSLCEAWYGLNDDPGGRFRKGPVDWAWTPEQPPFYPGHFHALSRYMFQPHPGELVETKAKDYGVALRAAMRAFVNDHRAANRAPVAPDGQPAPLAQATMDAFKNDSDTELAARTMVGVLMGFIPTISGAVVNVLYEWQRTQQFEALRAQLGGAPDMSQAQAVLGRALIDAARMRPMPQIIWRTALCNHTLGSGAHAIQIAAGEIVALGLVSGTQQALADGLPDGRLMFGGERDGAAPPMHACPGHKAGMGAMLGILAGLLSCPESMRAESEPLTFMISGKVSPTSQQRL